MNNLSKKIKTVIVSQRIDKIANRNEIRDSLDQELLIWLIESGYLPVQISNVLINDNNSFLISKRYANKFLGNLWELPGGKVKHKETQHDALIREMKEELDIKIIIKPHPREDTTLINRILSEACISNAKITHENSMLCSSLVL